MENWQEKDNSLVKEFEFKDFQGALDFIDKVGEAAEKMNHHPDLLLHSYNRVVVMLTTHHAGDVVTDRDRKLAAKIDEL